MTEQSKLVKIISAKYMACTQIFLLSLSGLSLSGLSLSALGSIGQAALAADQTSKVAAVSTAVATISPGSYSDDERALRDQAGEYAKIYAARDAKALASMWTAEGTFTDSKGQVHAGRGAIETYFREGFDEVAPQTLDIAIGSIKFPAPGVAIEEGTTRIASGPGLGSMGRYLVVHTKSDGKWLMETCSETDCSAESSAEYLKDLGWLVGTWSIKDRPNGAHLKVNWSKNKTFIVCRYFSEGAKDAPIADLQIIGWDPQSAQIVAWHFGALGGFGSGHLSCDGKSWTEKAVATEPDGTTGKARYRFTRLDDNNFTWQSSKRTISGHALPDSKELTITRDTVQ